MPFAAVHAATALKPKADLEQTLPELVLLTQPGRPAE